MTRIAFVDTETTGLHPERHDIWEVGLVLYEPPDKDGKQPAPEEYLWQLPANLAAADPDALRISRFYERRWDPDPDPDPAYGRGVTGEIDKDEDVVVPDEWLPTWAHRFAALTAGCVFAGMVPSFDAQRLDRLLRRHGAAPAWHYRPVCVEALARGYLLARWQSFDLREQRRLAQTSVERATVNLPWSSDDLIRALDLPLGGPGKHTALGDARTCVAIYEKILGLRA